MTKPSHPYYQINYKHTKRVQLQCNDPSLAKQSFSNECNINIIMSKYHKTGLISHVAKHNGNYMNLTNSQDYHASQNAILRADEAFNTLPSEIRSQFHNDPTEFLEFAQDPDNQSEMVEMGLATKNPQKAESPEDAEPLLPDPSPEDNLPSEPPA